MLPALERRIVEASVLGGGVAGVKQSAAGTAIQVAPGTSGLSTPSSGWSSTDRPARSPPLTSPSPAAAGNG